MSKALTLGQHLLAALRAAYHCHQTSHWQSKGSQFYGDHLMMQRLYESVGDEVDTLAEKLVGAFGSESVDCCDQITMISDNVHWADDKAGHDYIHRALIIEESLQTMLKKAYTELKATNELSLGMDDFIMGVANNHESNIYLLRQRLSR
jgi:DNA-binding ferritin-like protein